MRRALLVVVLLSSAFVVYGEVLRLELPVLDVHELRGVVDGDTLRIAPLDDVQELAWADRSEERVRLLCVSAPERSEPGGDDARAWLAEHAGHADVRIERGPEPRDTFGRMLGTVYAGDTNLNLEIVRSGRARFERRYRCPDPELFEAAELAARIEGLGVWAQK